MNDETELQSEANKARPSRAKTIAIGIISSLVVVAVAGFLLAGQISYALSECSKGPKQCLLGIAVAVGLVDIYDKDNRCTGAGCNY